MPSRYYQIKPETNDYKIWFLYFSVNELQLYCKSATTLCDRQYSGVFPSCPQLLDTPVRRPSQVGPPGRAEIAAAAGQHPGDSAGVRSHGQEVSLPVSKHGDTVLGGTESDLRDDGAAFLGTGDHWVGLATLEKVPGMTENES